MTADELALLRGVEAAPDDDLPRLVYADWLDEHGRHARAEFIRVQCERASIERRLPTMTKDQKRVEGPRRGWLLFRERELLEEDPIESRASPPIDWQDDLSGWWDWGRQVFRGYRRGFAEELSLTPNQNLDKVLRYSWAMVPRPTRDRHRQRLRLRGCVTRGRWCHGPRCRCVVLTTLCRATRAVPSSRTAACGEA